MKNNAFDVRVAALLTCHNRIELTRRCLRYLHDQRLPGNTSLEIYVVDDGSSDGTSDMIRLQFPDVHVIAGSGDLYWGGGTRLALEKALHKEFHYYLWVNDDIELIGHAVGNAIQLANSKRSSDLKQPIVVGAFFDPSDGHLTYGGWRRVNKLFPSIFRPMDKAGEPIECDTGNGNFVLIPGDVPKTIGNIDRKMIHVAGDFDYLLRARKAGFGIFVLPGYAGRCRGNEMSIESVLTRPNVLEAWREFTSVKCLPVSQWATFHRKHGGLLWPISFISPYIKFWLAIMMRPFRRLRRSGINTNGY